MGLDITWYRDVRPAPEAEVDEDGYPVDWDTFVRLTVNSDFPERCEDIPEGVYAYAESEGFPAVSYGGYNKWRENLAKMAGYPATPGPDISNLHLHSNGAWQSDGGPFFELIHFTDCDGVIGTAVSAKLAQDFADHQTKADATGDAWFLQQYGRWRTAFENAAQAGFVDFH